MGRGVTALTASLQESPWLLSGDEPRRWRKSKQGGGCHSDVREDDEAGQEQSGGEWSDWGYILKVGADGTS